LPKASTNCRTRGRFRYFDQQFEATEVIAAGVIAQMKISEIDSPERQGKDVRSRGLDMYKLSTGEVKPGLHYYDLVQHRAGAAIAPANLHCRLRRRTSI